MLAVYRATTGGRTGGVPGWMATRCEAGDVVVDAGATRGVDSTPTTTTRRGCGGEGRAGVDKVIFIAPVVSSSSAGIAIVDRPASSSRPMGVNLLVSARRRVASYPL